MLSGLLPGVRDLRAPLAAGLLVLTWLYLVLYGPVERIREGGRLTPSLEALINLIGDRGWIIVGAIAAYLLGSVFMLVRNQVVLRLTAGLLPTVVRPDYVYARTPKLWQILVAPFSRSSLHRLRQLMKDDPDDIRVQWIYVGIMFGGGSRLLVANTDLHEKYDRLTSEAEFRDAVILPGLGVLLLVLMNAQVSLVAEALTTLIAVGIGMVLFVQARALDREAHSMYAHAVADGVVGAEALEVDRETGQRWWSPRLAYRETTRPDDSAESSDPSCAPRPVEKRS